MILKISEPFHKMKPCLICAYFKDDYLSETYLYFIKIPYTNEMLLISWRKQRYMLEFEGIKTLRNRRKILGIENMYLV